MKHFGLRIAILTVCILALACMTIQAAGAEKSKKPAGIASLTKLRALSYAVPTDSRVPGPRPDRIPLTGVASEYESLSPGVTVGYTWYDWQQTASMGRMTETGPHSGHTGPTIVHFGWMHLPDSVFEGRTYMYNAFKSEDNTFAGAYRLHDPDDQYSGYVNVDVTPDNRALVGGHCDEKGPAPYQVQIHFDLCPACELFNAYIRIPDSVASYVPTGVETLWPKFFYQFGSDTVLHVIATVSSYLDPPELPAITYFRMVGFEGSPDTEFDYPPYVIDSAGIQSYDITGQRTGDRVAISWLASLPYQEPECDTCSGVSAYDGYLIGQMDNDIYCQISNDQGTTWEPRANITKAEIGQAADKAFADLSVLFDQAGYLHVVWTACPWPADPCVMYETPCFEEDFYTQKGRLLHWSENIPYIQTIADHTYMPSDSCGPPGWALTVAKPTISECDGKLYTIWSQFNDVSSGIDNDCAEWAYEISSYWGGANAEIWASMSYDGGLTWSIQRNLTNSYTPHCDPFEGEDCQSDYWPSMSRYGRQMQTGEDWTGATAVDPTGYSTTDFYLDIQYVNDIDAGGALMAEGGWTNSPIKWFRIPCYEDQVYPIFVAQWYRTVPPASIIVGEALDIPLWFQNNGGVQLTYSITIEEDNGPTGWLTVSGFSGTIPSGLNNREYGTVHINEADIITMTGNYTGRLHVEGNTPYGLPCDIEIELIVSDKPICYPYRDTVHTQCLSLIVSDNGNMGHQGYEKVNMDYYPEDCDSTAIIYLWDGSPFIGRLMGDDTVFNSAVWGDNIWSDYTFMPQCEGMQETKYCPEIGAEVFESGAFTSKDSTVAFERIWVAPDDDCEFILQYTKVWSWDGQAHDDLMLGEVIDWDVPWDFLVDDPLGYDHYAVNTGGTDGPRSLVYQQGYDAHGLGSDTGYPYNCQYNDERFAGNAFVESYLNGSFRLGGPYSGFIGENDELVYPATQGVVAGAFWQEAILSGMRGSDSTEDLHAAMTYEPALDLGATDVYEVVTVLATIQQGTLADLQAAIDAGKAWYAANGGMAMFADDNDDGQIDVCEGCCQVVGDHNDDGSVNPLDAVYFVNWMWKGGPEPPCLEQSDINCDCNIDPLDATQTIGWLWRGWPWIPGCNCEYLALNCGE